MRIEAAAREYQVKIADLKQKYGLRVVVELSQRLEIVAPVERLHLAIKRRKGERRITLDWNSVARRLEPCPTNGVIPRWDHALSAMTRST